MKRTIERITRTAMLAVAFMLCASSAWAVVPVPTVVWDGDFGTTEKTGSDGVTYTFAAGTGNSVENGKLVIGSGSGYGGKITWPLDANKGAVSVLIKYSSLDTTDKGTPALAAVTCMQCNSDGTPKNTIIEDCVCVKDVNGSKLTGRYNDVSTAYGGDVADIKSPSGYLLMVYASAAHFKFWTSSDGFTWSGGTATSLLFSSTPPQGVALGGISGSVSSSFGCTAGMTIEAVAIYRAVQLDTNKARNCHFDSEYTTQAYKKWAYANAVVSYNSNSGSDIGNTGTKVKDFNIADGKNRGNDCSCGTDTTYFGSAFWHNFCRGQTAYSAPGCVLRIATQVDVTAGFNPLTLGGLIIENTANGCSFSGDTRTTILGAASESSETWFGIKGNATISRSGFLIIAGTVNIDVVEGKTFTLSTSQPTIKANVTTANTGAGDAGGVLRMHGLGTITVQTLVASNSATLDFSDVQGNATVDRSTTPFIQGNLTVDATTKLVLPAGIADGDEYKICSGTLTAPTKTVQTSVQIGSGNAFTAYVTYNASNKTVSYSTSAPTYTGTVDGSTITWDVTPTTEDIENGNIVLTGSGEVTLAAEPISITAASGVTVVVTGYTSASLMGSGTFKYTSGYPASVPSGITYQYVGGATAEASVTIPGVTVNGVLKTSGYLTLTTFSLPSGCSLDVLDGSTRVEGSLTALKGDVAVRDNATLVYGSNDLLDYDGSTHADIYGTLEIDGRSTRLLNQSSNMELNFYGGSTIKGSGIFNIANDQGFNVKVNPDDKTKDTVSFQTSLKYNSKNSTSTITVDEGVTLAITGGSVFANSGNTAGSITKAGGGKIVFGSGCDASSFATTLNVNAGEAEISTTFGGTVVVASAATLTASGASPSITEPLTLKAGSTLAYGDDSQTITTSGALSLPASGKVTVDVSNLTIAANASKELLTVGSGMKVNKFSQVGNTETHVLSASGQTLSLVPIAATVTKSTGTVSYATLNEAVMELDTNRAREPDAYVTLVNASSSDLTVFSAEDLASAGIVYDESDGTYGFAAAEISSTKYATVAKAIAAAASSGDTVTLLRDCTVTDLSLAGKTITLDEGDYTFTGSFTGNGTLIMTAMPKAISSSRWSAGWTGTLWLKGVSFSNLNPGKCGNVNSTLKMTGCSGSFNEAHDSGNTFAGALELEDEGVTPALTINEGFPLHGYTSIGALKGSGTLTSGDTQRAQCFRFVDASEFEGAITISDSSYMRVVFGSGSTNYKSEAYKKIIVEEGASATIAADKTWSAAGGVVVDGTLTLATSTSALSGAVTGSGRVVFVNTLPASSLHTSFKDSANWTGTVEIKEYTQPTDTAVGIIVLNNYGNINSTVALNGVISTMFANTSMSSSNYPDVTLKEIEIGDGGWTDHVHGEFNCDMFYTAKLTGHGKITVKTTGSGSVKFIGDHTFDGSVEFDSGTGKQVAFMRTAGDTIPAVTAGAIVVAGRSNMSIASGKTWTAPGGIKIDGSLTVLTAEATTATSVTPTAYKDGAQIETLEDAIAAGTTTYATGMVVSNQDSMGDVTVIGGQSISGSGGTYMSSLTINDGATLTYDPVITPIRVESAPVFNGTGKLKLAARYAGVTCGKFHLVSYPSSASVSGTLADLVDSTSFNNASYTVTEETVGSYKQLVLKVGDYDTNAKPVSIAQFGDSITEGIWRSGYRGTPNYRIPLMQLLEAYGYRPEARGYRSVGSTDANGVPADDNYKWHTGISAQRIYTGHTTTGTPSDANLRAGFMESIEAHLEQVGVTDIITLKIGTNDSIGNETADNMFEGWTNLVWKIVRMRPTSKIVVCAPVKIRTGENNAPGLRTKIAEYMALTPEQGGFPAGQVTMINGINIVTDDANYYLTDNVHPNWNGHLQLANAWLPAVTNAFESMTARATTGYTAQTVASAADAAELAAYRAGYVKLATFTNFDTKLNTWGETPYSYVNNDYKDTPMGRVAYFVARKTTASPDTRYVWVDMDADSTTGTTLADFGVPTSASVNGVVNNLHIYSNSSAIENVAPTVSGVKGTLMRTEKDVDKADGISTDLAPTGPYGFDWNDTINGSGAWGVLNMARIFDGATPTNHRKLLAAQMLFDFNGFNGGRQNALGIGDFAVHGPYNYANDSVDHFNLNWTFTTDKDEMPTMDARALETGVIEIWGKQVYTATMGESFNFSELTFSPSLPGDLTYCDLVVNVTDNATLTFDSAMSVGSITFNIAENKTLTLADVSNLTAGKVIVYGTGTLKIAGSITTDIEVFDDATFAFGSGESLAITGNLIVASGKTLTIVPEGLSVASTTLLSAASIDGSVSVALAGLPVTHDYTVEAEGTEIIVNRVVKSAKYYNAAVGKWNSSWAFSGGYTIDRLRPGPNDEFSTVIEVSDSFNPYTSTSGFRVPSDKAWSFSIYADVSKMSDSTSARPVIACFGNYNNSDALILYREGDSVKLRRHKNGNAVGGWAASVPAIAGFHLYTFTCDPKTGIVELYADTGDNVNYSSNSGTPEYLFGEMSLSAGFQLGAVFGTMPSGFAKGTGMAVASFRYYEAALDAGEVAILADEYPAVCNSLYGQIDNLGSYNSKTDTGSTLGLSPTLTIYSGEYDENAEGYIGISNGTLLVPQNNTVSVPHIRVQNATSGSTTVNIRGVVNVTSESNDPNLAWVSSGIADYLNYKGVLLGNKNTSGTGAFNVYGTLDASRTYIQTVNSSTGEQTLTVDGGTLKVKCFYADRSNASTVTLQGGGTLEMSETIKRGQSITYNFGYGVFKANANMEISSSRKMITNFCGEQNQPTTLDPNGYVLTMAGDALSGSGHIKIASGTTGKVIFNGGSFTGTVVIDANAATVQGTIPGTLKSGVADNCVCSVTVNATTTYYPTFASAIEAAGENEITVYGYNNETLPDHYRVKDGKLELIPGTIFSVW